MMKEINELAAVSKTVAETAASPSEEAFEAGYQDALLHIASVIHLPPEEVTARLRQLRQASIEALRREDDGPITVPAYEDGYQAAINDVEQRMAA